MCKIKSKITQILNLPNQSSISFITIVILSWKREPRKITSFFSKIFILFSLLFEIVESQFIRVTSLCSSVDHPFHFRTWYNTLVCVHVAQRVKINVFGWILQPAGSTRTNINNQDQPGGHLC